MGRARAFDLQQQGFWLLTVVGMLAGAVETKLIWQCSCTENLAAPNYVNCATKLDSFKNSLPAGTTTASFPCLSEVTDTFKIFDYDIGEYDYDYEFVYGDYSSNFVGDYFGDYGAISTGLISLDLPVLRKVGKNFKVGYNEGLTSLKFPEFRRVGGDFTLAVTNTLTSLNAPVLANVGKTFSVSSNSALTSLDLPSLTEVGGDMLFESNALELLDLPALTKVGGFLLAGKNSFSEAKSARFPLLTSISNGSCKSENGLCDTCDDCSVADDESLFCGPFFVDGSCPSSPPSSCKSFTRKRKCKQAGCRWKKRLGKCVRKKTSSNTCKAQATKKACNRAGCTWKKSTRTCTD